MGGPGRCPRIAIAAPAGLLRQSRGLFLSSGALWRRHGEIHPVPGAMEENTESKICPALGPVALALKEEAW